MILARHSVRRLNLKDKWAGSEIAQKFKDTV